MNNLICRINKNPGANTMKNTVSLLAGISLLISTAAVAQENGDGTIERAVEYRQSLMTVLGWNMKSMGAMLKGKQPYEPALFTRRARDLNAAAHLDLSAGFPEDSVNDESDAKDEIWLDWEKFLSKLDAMREKSDALARIADSNDMNAVRKAYSELGKSCKSCHKAFRK